jgi:NitT/TauT family transport system substrate-binding protein
MKMGSALAMACLATMAMAAPAGAAEHEWQHAIITAKSDSGIFYMVGNGFAKKEGLDLKLIQVQNDAIGLKALLAGQIDSYEGAPAGAMIAASRGADVNILGCSWQGLPHGVFVHGNITTPQQLKGKTIAISAPGAMPDQLARALLAKYKIPVDDVTLASLGGDNDRYKALVAGLADAAVISGEYTPIAAKAGIHLLIPGHEVLPDFIRVCLMSSSKVEKERHDDLVRFLAAEISALRYATTHRAEALALTHKVANVKPGDPRPAYIYDLALKQHAISTDITAPLDKLNWMQEQSIKAGDQPHKVDLAKVVVSGPREDALKLLAGQK